MIIVAIRIMIVIILIIAIIVVLVVVMIMFRALRMDKPTDREIGSWISMVPAWSYVVEELPEQVLSDVTH